MLIRPATLSRSIMASISAVSHANDGTAPREPSPAGTDAPQTTQAPQQTGVPLVLIAQEPLMAVTVPVPAGIVVSQPSGSEECSSRASQPTFALQVPGVPDSSAMDFFTSKGFDTWCVDMEGYGRSDKKDQPRVPITARLIADMITVAGADRVLTMDLHQGQIQGFFNIPVDELTAVHLLSNYFRHKHIENLVVVTDLGFAKRARAFAELLDAPLAIIEKRRVGNLDRRDIVGAINFPAGEDFALRLQGAYLSTEETEGLMDWYRTQAKERKIDERKELGERKIVSGGVVPGASGSR